MRARIGAHADVAGMRQPFAGNIAPAWRVASSDGAIAATARELVRLENHTSLCGVRWTGARWHDGALTPEARTEQNVLTDLYQPTTSSPDTVATDDHGLLAEESYSCLRYAVKPP